MPGESYRRRLMCLLLYWCYVFRALINSLVCCVDSFKRGLQIIQAGFANHLSGVCNSFKQGLQIIQVEFANHLCRI